MDPDLAAQAFFGMFFAYRRDEEKLFPISGSLTDSYSIDNCPGSGILRAE
jgi:hypothetical protein